MNKHCLRGFVAIFVFLSFGLTVKSQTDVYAITGAKIVTVSGATIEQGTVVIRDGLIESVGAAVKVPADAKVFDGKGLTVYPGLIDTNTELGIQKVPPRPAGQPGAGNQPQSNSNYSEWLRPEQTAVTSLKAGDAQFENQRNNGFTTALTVEDSGIFQGQSAVINLAGDSVSSMIVRSPFAQHVSFRTERGNFPASLMGTFAALRQMFLDAKRLGDIKKLYADNPRGMKRPESDRSLEALIPIVNGQGLIVFNVDTEREIIRALDLSKEFNLKAVIAGAQESYKVVDRLKAANVPVLLSLNLPKRTLPESKEAEPESLETLRLRAEAPKNAALLKQAGIRFAFQSGGIKNLKEFFENAGQATKNGLAAVDAIRAMTLTSAEILGVSDQLGSIEKGKIANLIVTRGDLLADDRKITHVFVDGKWFEQEEKKPAAGGDADGSGKISQVGGTWTITIEPPGQTIPATITLNQQGSSLTGTLASSMFGSTPISNGKATASGFSFSATVNVGGTNLDVVFDATVTGNRVEGTVDTPQGPAVFSGTKNP